MRHAKNGLAVKFTMFILTCRLASSRPCEHDVTCTAALAPATKSEAARYQALIAPQIAGIVIGRPPARPAKTVNRWRKEAD